MQGSAADAAAATAGSSSACLLLKAAVLALGVADMRCADTEPLSTHLLRRFGGGVSVLIQSSLPAGSGAGGSSVLAGAALQSVRDLLWEGGMERKMEWGEIEDSGMEQQQHHHHQQQQQQQRLQLVSLVSLAEQLMTSGGGWQDQVGSIFPGFKIARSAPMLPLTVQAPAQSHSKSQSRAHAQASTLSTAFTRRVCLVYTGQQRLAKNVLVNALRRSALTPIDEAPTLRTADPDGGGTGDSADPLHLRQLEAVLQAWDTREKEEEQKQEKEHGKLGGL
ncbi:hypothetical protein B484DRAFT_426762 [Ochromonadaceae sp. CCMP2298]|nr:hypothetical protein B484DRAFT_426762 [Ochromonadaceae sp. CCMP2298]